MRPSIALALLLLAQQAAVAHVPGSEQSLVEAINHQLFSPQHLPITVALTVAATVLAGLGIHKTMGAAVKKR